MKNDNFLDLQVGRRHPAVDAFNGTGWGCDPVLTGEFAVAQMWLRVAAVVRLN
jgi:hypothetical protein